MIAHPKNDHQPPQKIIISLNYDHPHQQMTPPQQIITLEKNDHAF